MRINQLQQQVGTGQYQVDTQAVADAILRRLLGAGGSAAGTSESGRSDQ